MKVRLKQKIAKISDSLKSKFQFHEGPIKTEPPKSLSNLCRLFQFHEGPIKTQLLEPKRVTDRSFNSMKVRLKRCVSLPVVAFLSFNSMKVRLKRSRCMSSSSPCQVSIP